MRRKHATFVILLVATCLPCVSPLCAQGSPARRIIAGPTLPTTCLSSVLIQDVFQKSGASAGFYVCTAPSVWTLMANGSTGSVASVGLAGTANQITVTGASPITTSGSWTLSFPAGGVTLPGTTTGTFSGGLTGNVTGNVSGSSGTVTDATVAHSSNNLSFFSATTSAQLATLLSDETGGGGVAVFSGSPTILTPIIASFANATHNHQNAAGGGTLTDAAITFTAPALGAPTATTVQTSGHIGLAVAPPATAGIMLLAQEAANNNTIIKVINTDAADAAANAGFQSAADTAQVSIAAQGTGRSVSRAGVTIGGWSEIIASAGNGLLLGTSISAPLRLYTNSVAAIVVDTSQGVTLPILAMTAGTMTATNAAVASATVHRYDWTNAMVTALGASTTGDITVCTLPAKVVVRNVYVVIDTADTSANALTVAVGRTSAAFIDYVVASDAKASANTVYGATSGTRGTNLTGYDLPSITGTTAIKAHFIKTTTNLSTVVASTGHIYIETTTLP